MLASEVMDESVIFLNDTAKSLYTYDVQLPYLKRANADLEKELAVNGIQIQRVKSSAITVDAGVLTLTLPADFLMPIRLRERFVGENDNQWVDMIEKVWESTDDYSGKTYLEYWAFRNNAINFTGCSVDKEVLLEYERNLSTFTSENSTIDSPVIKQYLSARTAELCARYVGMNIEMATDIKINETNPAADALIRLFILEGQAVNRVRRQPFNSKRLEVY